MNHPTDDELISAYLDGELSGEELLRAERLLEERPEYRQWVDELRAIGGGLRDLPRHTLDDDFAERVLRRAEREMLSTAPPTNATATNAQLSNGSIPAAPTSAAPIASPRMQEGPAYGAPETSFLSDRMSWRRWRRPLVWSSLAAAAALLIMFLGPPPTPVRQADQEVALGPAPRARAGADLAAEAAPAADDLATSTAGTALHESLGSSMKAAPSPDQSVAGDSLPEKDGDGTALHLGYRAEDLKRRAQRDRYYNFFALQADGQTSPAQPLTDDVQIVQFDVKSVDDAQLALRELLAQQQFAWGDSPASGNNGVAAADGRQGGAKAGAAAGLGGGRGGGFGGGGQVAAEAITPAATPPAAQAAKAEQLAKKPAESKADSPAPAAEFGFLREAQELGVNRSLDRRQLEHERLGREQLGREPLGQRKAGEEGEQRQSLFKAILVEGPSAQVDAVVAGLAAQRDLVRQVVVSETPATLEDGATGDATHQKQALRSDAYDVNRDYTDKHDTDSTQLGSLKESVPLDRPITPATPDNKPALMPLAPAATERGKRGESGKQIERAKESSRSESDDRSGESSRSHRGTERPRNVQRNRSPAEPSQGPPPAQSAAPRPAPSRALAESSPAPAEAKAEGKPAQPSPTPSALFGRAQEVMVPEGALGGRESAQQQLFGTRNWAASKGAASDQSQLERFGKIPTSQIPASQIPDSTAEPPPVGIDLKDSVKEAGKSAPDVAGKGQERARAKGVVAGEEIEATKATGGGKGKNASEPSRGMQLQLGEENQPAGTNQTRDNQRGDEKQSGDKKLNDRMQRGVDAAGKQFHNAAPRQVAADTPAQRRVIFVFNVQSPEIQSSEVAAPAEETAPAVRTAPAKPE